jgi:DNA-binding NarL/FixJ family response regulator
MTHLPLLSARQQQVMDLMLEGLPSRVIADRLGISVNTVKEHRGLILHRMGVDSTLALIKKMQQAPTMTPPVGTESLATKPPQVLVVKEEEAYRELIVSGLRMNEFNCRGVSNSQEMITALDEEKPDAVVLDLNLGTEDGLDIAQRLRAEHPCLGIVMMTGRGLMEQRIEGFLAGADVYLAKPVDIRELVVVIRNLHRRMLESRAMAFL